MSLGCSVKTPKTLFTLGRSVQCHKHFSNPSTGWQRITRDYMYMSTFRLKHEKIVVRKVWPIALGSLSMKMTWWHVFSSTITFIFFLWRSLFWKQYRDNYEYILKSRLSTQLDCTKSVYDTGASHRYDPGTGRFSLYKTTEATLGYSANLKDLGKLAFFQNTWL
jgi:hypothetical protein